MVNGAETANWLQLAVGYSLTGHSSEEILFYLFGPPRSGKGTFTETLLALLGKPLSAEVNFSTFTEKRGKDDQNFDLAPLKPCRLVVASESNEHERFNEGKIKSITGGSEIYCAFKHHDQFNYKPQFKIWLSSNHPVNADPTDDAVWGRIRVIEFPHSFLGVENKRLKAKMRSKEVLEGVLAWAVEGARKWYALPDHGLAELDTSRQVKALQRAELDNVQVWLDECCAKEPEHFTTNAEIYTSYSMWCKDNGVTPKQQKALSQALSAKKFEPKVVWTENKAARGFYGFRIN
jgi:putative DNA primase/helicase